MKKLACSMSAWKNSIDDALVSIRSMGFTYVDVIALPGWGLVDPVEVGADSDAVADRLADTFNRHSCIPIGVNAAVPNIYQRDDASVNEQRRKQVDGICHLMKRLKIPVASFFPGSLWPAREMPWEKVLEGESETLEEMCAAGKRHGVTLTIEPHANTPFETPAQVRALLDAVPGLRVTYDPSHFALQEVPLADTAFILDRAAHVHVRDAGPQKMQMPAGEGTVDFAWLLDSLRRRNYSGALSIEYLPGNENQIPAMKAILQKLLEDNPDR